MIEIVQAMKMLRSELIVSELTPHRSSVDLVVNSARVATSNQAVACSEPPDIALVDNAVTSEPMARKTADAVPTEREAMMAKTVSGETVERKPVGRKPVDAAAATKPVDAAAASAMEAPAAKPVEAPAASAMEAPAASAMEAPAAAVEAPAAAVEAPAAAAVTASVTAKR